MRELVRLEPGVQVVWRAFELRPEPIPTLDPKGEYLRRAWRNSVYPLAEKFGMRMALPPVQPRSRLAHEASHWARKQGRFNDYHAAIFRALFERGEDIGKIGTLASLASELGLESEALRRALENRELESSVLDDEREARASGVGGVPAFAAEGSVALTGVQSLESLQTLVDRVRALRG